MHPRLNLHSGDLSATRSVILEVSSMFIEAAGGAHSPADLPWPIFRLTQNHIFFQFHWNGYDLNGTSSVYNFVKGDLHIQIIFLAFILVSNFIMLSLVSNTTTADCPQTELRRNTLQKYKDRGFEL